MSEFDYNVIHKLGTMNEADYFMRQPTGKVDVETVQESNHSEMFVRFIIQSALPDAITLKRRERANKMER